MKQENIDTLKQIADADEIRLYVVQNQPEKIVFELKSLEDCVKMIAMTFKKDKYKKWTLSFYWTPPEMDLDNIFPRVPVISIVNAIFGMLKQEQQGEIYDQSR